MAVIGEYLPRIVDAELAAACSTFPIVVIDGPRAVGKTTSARRLAASTVYLPDDLDRLRPDLGGYLTSLAAPVLIDEWQLAGVDLLWTLKRIVDDDPSPGRFVLTGSVEPATYGPTYPLTGRAARVVMLPMTSAELAGRGGERSWFDSVVAGEPTAATAGRVTDFSVDRLLRSGFPAGRDLPDSTMFMDGYAALVAQRGGDEGRDAHRLLTTMRVLATLESQAVPSQRIWEAADINKVTWKLYEDLLARTHLVDPSPAFATNRVQRLTMYPKRYFVDTALALTLANVTRERLLGDTTLTGRYFESHVLQQLRPQVRAAGATLSHLRTSAGEREVDAVVERGLDVYGVEVKYHSRPTPRDAAHLAWLRDQIGDRFVAGFVVHPGGDTYPLGERLWALPIDTL